MRGLLLVPCVFFTLQAGATTLDEVKTALKRLNATQPLRGTFTTEASVKATGRFANDTSKRRASVQVAHDAGGLSITFPSALLERSQSGSQDIIGSIRSIDVVEAIDYRDALLTLLAHATVEGEGRSTVAGRSARFLQLKLHPPPKKESGVIRIGSVKSEDRMKLWIGDDHLPLVAERTEKSSAGIMMLRASGSSRTVYTFGNAAGRLILARVETSVSGSGLGQNVERQGVQTLTVH
jgi:hypothetical protein